MTEQWMNAALDGGPGFANKSYFFRDNQYVRFDWQTGQVDADPQPILGNWPGLLELLAAGRATATQWLTQAQQQVVAYTAALQAGRRLASTRRCLSRLWPRTFTWRLPCLRRSAAST